MTTPRGIRNRNPGNIVVSGWTQRQTGYQGPEPEGRFARFDTMANGLAALIRLLQSYREQHGLTTVRGIINRWAPPVENNTSAYVLAVAKVLDVAPDQELADEPVVYHNLAHAIAAHENGRDAAEAAITARDYAEAMASVFGVETVVAAPPPAEEPKKEWKMSPLVIPAITALIDAIPNLLRIFKGDSKTVERNAKAVEVVSAVVKEVTGTTSVAAGVEEILSNPELRAKTEAAVQAKWYELSEVGGGIEAARKHDADFRAKGDSVWKSPSFIVALMLIPLVYIGMVSASLRLPIFPDWPFEIRVAIVSSVIGMVLGGIVGYYFGMMTSRNRATVAQEK